MRLLTLRQTQVDAFATLSRHAWVDRMLAYCRQHHARRSAALGAAEARRLVEVALANGERNGFTSDADIARYAELVFLLGERFEVEQEWAGQVLAESWGLGLSEGLARLHVTGLAMAEAEEADAVEASAAGALV
jgi:hypothetical protein